MLGSTLAAVTKDCSTPRQLGIYTDKSTSINVEGADDTAVFGEGYWVMPFPCPDGVQLVLNAYAADADQAKLKDATPTHTLSCTFLISDEADELESALVGDIKVYSESPWLTAELGKGNVIQNCDGVFGG